MREILFRGKRRDNSKWVYGCLDFNKDKALVFIRTPSNIYTDVNMVDPATVGQYTGLTDKNGKKIFEGDIVRLCKYAFEWEDPESWDFKKGVIAFEDGCFVINEIYSSDGYNELSCVYSEIHFGDDYDESAIFEVIGNIHDNPELLN